MNNESEIMIVHVVETVSGSCRFVVKPEGVSELYFYNILMEFSVFSTFKCGLTKPRGPRGGLNSQPRTC